MKKQLRGKGLWLSLGLAATLALAPAAFGSGGGNGHGGAEAASAKTIEETLQTAVAGNDHFRQAHDRAYFEPYQQGQTPNLTVLTCSDSRVHTPLFGQDPHNNIFIIRNIGNQIGNSEGSVDYGVLHLPTKVLLILGHSSCGAVKAAMGDYSGETSGIKAELEPLRPVIATDDGSGNVNRRWAQNVEKNVDYQVEQARRLYKDKIESNEMAVVGAVYDFNDNYGKGRGTLVITNINGETDPNRLSGHPALRELSRGAAVSHVGSISPAVEWRE